MASSGPRCVAERKTVLYYHSMELNQFTDYSLRTLIVAALKNGDLTSVREVAASFSISENHLVKVVHKLSKLGYLETIRGRSGGIRLAKAPESIPIGEVVRAVESFTLVDCMPPRTGECRIAGVCRLQGLLHRASAAFFRELDSQTLADLVANEVELRDRLGM
ncbi:MAG: Rrf2 family transcriptional regulator [Verrucomicrobiales bacterium]|nr:Rrf2 family transcriptional regulator [Verrucomicrobiales bacterium]